MAIPAKAIGGGHFNNATQVFRVVFSEALSSAPFIEGWGNTTTFPGRDASGSNLTREIVAGTAGNNYLPMMAAWSGGASEPGERKPGANWHPDSPTPGGANPNLLKGTSNYVICQNTPGAGGNTVFNLSLRVPFDATVPSSDQMNGLVQIRYTYTGAAPEVTFFFNEGTEESPSWTSFTPGMHGIRFCNPDTVPPVYKLTLPESGQVYAAELWVTA